MLCACQWVQNCVQSLLVKKIVKIGQYLAKIWTKYDSLLFSGPPCTLSVLRCCCCCCCCYSNAWFMCTRTVDDENIVRRRGNWRGQKPFTKGPACSKCGSGAGWCTNGLCNSKHYVVIVGSVWVLRYCTSWCKSARYLLIHSYIICSVMQYWQRRKFYTQVFKEW